MNRVSESGSVIKVSNIEMGFGSGKVKEVGKSELDGGSETCDKPLLY